MATTFATNHIRQIGIGLAKECKHRHTQDKAHRKKLQQHFEMLLFFLIGAVIGTVLCNLFVGKAIWATLLPLGVILVTLLHADFVVERDLLERKPAGH